MKRARLLLWVAFCSLPPVAAAQQSGQAVVTEHPQPVVVTQHQQPDGTVPDTEFLRSLSDTQRQGAFLYKQRCNGCHAPTMSSPRSFGPLLSKVNVEGKVDAARQRIMEGSSRMPAFKYGLQPSQVDAIIDYLKRVDPVSKSERPAAVTTAVAGSTVGHDAPGNGGVLLTGTITAASGEKMEGVAVSARGDGRTVAVSVFSDAQGQYDFFPRLDAGKYKVWAQAVGYEAGRADIGLTGPVQRQDFALKTMKDFSSQLSGAEWSQALPEVTVEDKRMKEVFRNACNGCHNQNMALITPFDQKGWEVVIEVMGRIQTTGYGSSDDQAPNPLMDYYKKDLAAWLAKVRGPASAPLKFTPPPRPTGTATLMVVHEYDTPERGYGLPGYNDGSDWSQGPLDKLDNAHHHAINATLDFNGNLWFTDDVNLNPYRSVGKIDARTGKITDFKVSRPDGLAANVHDIQTDPEGILWFDVGGQLGRIDPNTEKLETYAPPAGMGRVGIFISIDGNGGVWCLSGPGALRFDRKTKQFRFFKNPTQKSLEGSTATYGIAGDSEGNGWWSHDPDRPGGHREQSDWRVERFPSARARQQGDAAVHRRRPQDIRNDGRESVPGTRDAVGTEPSQAWRRRAPGR